MKVAKHNNVTPYGFRAVSLLPCSVALIFFKHEAPVQRGARYVFLFLKKSHSHAVRAGDAARCLDAGQA